MRARGDCREGVIRPPIRQQFLGPGALGKTNFTPLPNDGRCPRRWGIELSTHANVESIARAMAQGMGYELVVTNVQQFPFDNEIRRIDFGGLLGTVGPERIRRRAGSWDCNREWFATHGAYELHASCYIFEQSGRPADERLPRKLKTAEGYYLSDFLKVLNEPVMMLADGRPVPGITRAATAFP